jgi:hypothetical protein
VRENGLIVSEIEATATTRIVTRKVRLKTIISATLSAILWFMKSKPSSACVRKANLKILEILPEAWTGQPYRFGWQDIVILER